MRSTPAAEHIEAGIATEEHRALLRAMMRIRVAEEALAHRYGEQEMRTSTHFSIGQEAVAVGVCAGLNRDDVVYSGHRCHAHYLTKDGRPHARLVLRAH